MIFVAGAGGMAQAAKAMRKIQQGINRRVARSKRRARSAELKYAGYETERTDFPCKNLCGTCGLFVDELGDDEAPEQPCPVCSDTNWIDLAVKPVADRLREVEECERMSPPTWISATVLVGSLALCAALAGGLWMAGLSGAAGWAVLSTLFVVPLAYYALPQPLSVWFLQGRERPPARWHEPFPLPSESATPETTLEAAEVRGTGETVEAPVTGRECLAYQLCVLFDTPGDARPPEWALQEQRAAEIEVDGERVEPNDLFLESPVRIVGASGSDMIDSQLPDHEFYNELDEADLKIHLRKRGLFINEGEFHFYEAVLEEGDEVEAETFEEACVLRDPSASEGEDLPDLPEGAEPL